MSTFLDNIQTNGICAFESNNVVPRDYYLYTWRKKQTFIIIHLLYNKCNDFRKHIFISPISSCSGQLSSNLENGQADVPKH